MLTAVARESTHGVGTTFRALPIMVAIGGLEHASELADAAARLACRSDSMVLVHTVTEAESTDSSTGRTAGRSWATALDRAVSTLHEYRVPYRVSVDDRPVSSVEPDRARELAWAIWTRARQCRAQSVVVGACRGIEPGQQVHTHVAAAGAIPVLAVPLPSTSRNSLPRRSDGDRSGASPPGTTTFFGVLSVPLTPPAVRLNPDSLQQRRFSGLGRADGNIANEERSPDPNPVAEDRHHARSVARTRSLPGSLAAKVVDMSRRGGIEGRPGPWTTGG